MEQFQGGHSHSVSFSEGFDASICSIKLSVKAWVLLLLSGTLFPCVWLGNEDAAAVSGRTELPVSLADCRHSPDH